MFCIFVMQSQGARALKIQVMYEVKFAEVKASKFVQLKTGNWAGVTREGMIYVSVEKYSIGDAPDDIRKTVAKLATTEESSSFHLFYSKC
jgi:hypothetical protein